MARKSIQTKIPPMGKYRQKPDVGSGDEVTETLLEIMPLARRGFDDVVNIPDLREAVDEDYEERKKREAEKQTETTPGNIITTQASIEIVPTETGTCLT